VLFRSATPVVQIRVKTSDNNEAVDSEEFIMPTKVA